jgi:hypothetical protein
VSAVGFVLSSQKIAMKVGADDLVRVAGRRVLKLEQRRFRLRVRVWALEVLQVAGATAFDDQQQLNTTDCGLLLKPGNPGSPGAQCRF